MEQFLGTRIEGEEYVVILKSVAEASGTSGMAWETFTLQGRTVYHIAIGVRELKLYVSSLECVGMPVGPH